MEKSNQTKMQLAAAFKEVLEKNPFQNVIVSQISDMAGMSRKSFYYHFKDKYDLVNWIFDAEFADVMKESRISGCPCLEKLCHYLYEQKSYYRRVLYTDGQNCFSDYLDTYICNQLLAEFSEQENAEVKSLFMADAIVVMIKRWLWDLEQMDADQFVRQLYGMLRFGRSAVRI